MQHKHTACISCHISKQQRIVTRSRQTTRGSPAAVVATDAAATTSATQIGLRLWLYQHYSKVVTAASISSDRICWLSNMINSIHCGAACNCNSNLHETQVPKPPSRACSSATSKPVTRNGKIVCCHGAMNVDIYVYQRSGYGCIPVCIGSRTNHQMPTS